VAADVAADVPVNAAADVSAGVSGDAEPRAEEAAQSAAAPLTTTATAPVAQAPGAAEPPTKQASPADAAEEAPALSPPEAAHLHVPGEEPARAANGSFDELAFLSGIVGADAPKTVQRDETRGGSALDDMLGTGSAGGRRSGEAPLASNIPGNTPIILRSSGAMEQSKTLKCTDCGAMNYPTEWYCERCGAELAAL
jgi:hypothetical protein